MKWQGQLLFTSVWCKGIFVSAPSELLHWPWLTALNILKFAPFLHACLVVSRLWDDSGFPRAALLGYQGKGLSSCRWGHYLCLSCSYPPLSAPLLLWSSRGCTLAVIHLPGCSSHSRFGSLVCQLSFGKESDQIISLHRNLQSNLHRILQN